MTDPTTNPRVPPVAAGEPAPCHPGWRLSGTSARVWCAACGRGYQAAPGEVLPAGEAAPAGAGSRR